MTDVEGLSLLYVILLSRSWVSWRPSCKELKEAEPGGGGGTAGGMHRHHGFRGRAGSAKQALPSAPTCWRHRQSGIAAVLSLLLVKGIVWKPTDGSQHWEGCLGSKFLGGLGLSWLVLSHMSSQHPHTHSSIHISIHPSIHPSVYSPTHSPIHLSIHTSIYIFEHSYSHPLIHLSIHSSIQPIILSAIEAG